MLTLCTAARVPQRPEGVTLSDWSSRFVILNLEPLDEEQQRIAIMGQLKSQPDAQEFLARLLDFAFIRNEQERIYRDVAFVAEEQEAIEKLPFCDRLFREDGSRDPLMRQTAPDGEVRRGAQDPTMPEHACRLC